MPEHYSLHLGFWPEHKRNMAIIVSPPYMTVYLLIFYLSASQWSFHMALRAEEGCHCPYSDIVKPYSPPWYPISRTNRVGWECCIKPPGTIGLLAEWFWWKCASFFHTYAILIRANTGENKQLRSSSSERSYDWVLLHRQLSHCRQASQSFSPIYLPAMPSARWGSGNFFLLSTIF